MNKDQTETRLSSQLRQHFIARCWPTIIVSSLQDKRNRKNPKTTLIFYILLQEKEFTTWKNSLWSHLKIILPCNSSETNLKKHLLVPRSTMIIEQRSTRTFVWRYCATFDMVKGLWNHTLVILGASVERNSTFSFRHFLNFIISYSEIGTFEITLLLY